MVVAGLVSLMLFLFITRDAIVVDEFVRPNAEAAGGTNATGSSDGGGGSTAFSPSDASLATLDSINYASMRFWFYMLMPAILYGCLIPLLDWLFTRVAHVFNDLENYRTESSYRNHLILKVRAPAPGSAVGFRWPGDPPTSRPVHRAGLHVSLRQLLPLPLLLRVQQAARHPSTQRTGASRTQAEVPGTPVASLPCPTLLIPGPGRSSPRSSSRGRCGTT